MSSISTKIAARPRYINNPTGRILSRFALLVLVYVLLIFLLPDNQKIISEHRLTSAQYHILRLLVGLPLIVVWLAAFYGYSKLESYTISISKTAEALGFRRLTQGCAWIAWSLPVHSITAMLARAISNAQPEFTSVTIIASNYIDLLFPVIGFTLIGMASRHLFDRNKMSISAASIRGITLVFVIGGALYCYLIFRQFTGSGLGGTDNPYHLPAWLAVLTVIVPYLYAWFAGLLAIYELITYGRHVRGVLYRRAMLMLVVGVFIMIVGSIAFQYAHSFQPVADSYLILESYLLVNLLFQIVTAIGFVMIALGTLRLKKIEEV